MFFYSVIPVGSLPGSGCSHAATIACKEKTIAMTNESTTGSPAWDPEATGHALFATRVGPCGVAWGACGLVAFQLPEVDGPAATRTRMSGVTHAAFSDSNRYTDTPQSSSRRVALPLLCRCATHPATWGSCRLRK